MKFHFRLETLLNWKKGLEEQSRIIVARKVEELKKQEEKIKFLVNERIDQFKKFEKKLQKGMDSSEYFIYQQFNEQNYEDLSKQKISKYLKEQEIDQEQKILIEIIKEKKILERLKERKLMRFNYQKEKNEQKFLDEFLIRKHSIKS